MANNSKDTPAVRSPEVIISLKVETDQGAKWRRNRIYLQAIPGRQAQTAVDSPTVTHLDETSHMSAEFVFRYGPKCMGGLILPILVLLHL